MNENEKRERKKGDNRGLIEREIVRGRGRRGKEGAGRRGKGERERREEAKEEKKEGEETNG